MICGIVLAAGLSRQMGSQKLLLPFGGKTVIGHIVDQLLASAIGEVHVVVGHPILFSALYRDETLTQYGDIGLRGLLEGHSGDIFELAVTTASVLYDMDCPEDYRRELGLNEQNME